MRCTTWIVMAEVTLSELIDFWDTSGRFMSMALSTSILSLVTVTHRILVRCLWQGRKLPDENIAPNFRTP